jgi:hypothetical protein
MIMRRRIAGFVAAAVVAGLAAMPAHAQKADQTASQFYLAYRAAFDKAKAIDDLLPYMSKKNVDQVKATPADQRAKMFEMIKEMGALKNVKILKEAKNGDGATLTVEALGPPDNAKTTGTIDIIKESGAWKIGKESWSSGP